MKAVTVPPLTHRQSSHTHWSHWTHTTQHTQIYTPMCVYLIFLTGLGSQEEAGDGDASQVLGPGLEDRWTHHVSTNPSDPHHAFFLDHRPSQTNIHVSAQILLSQTTSNINTAYFTWIVSLKYRLLNHFDEYTQIMTNITSIADLSISNTSISGYSCSVYLDGV